jgi:hypothetical protein
VFPVRRKRTLGPAATGSGHVLVHAGGGREVHPALSVRNARPARNPGCPPRAGQGYQTGRRNHTAAGTTQAATTQAAGAERQAGGGETEASQNKAQGPHEPRGITSGPSTWHPELVRREAPAGPFGRNL